MDAHGTVFCFEQSSVGFLTDELPPIAPGTYSYEPFRGPGHYGMGQALRRSGVARCWYGQGASRVWFSVQGTGSYGKLLLSDFSFGAKDELAT
jgi:hypothetical protein